MGTIACVHLLAAPRATWRAATFTRCLGERCNWLERPCSCLGERYNRVELLCNCRNLLCRCRVSELLDMVGSAKVSLGGRSLSLDPVRTSRLVRTSILLARASLQRSVVGWLTWERFGPERFDFAALQTDDTFQIFLECGAAIRRLSRDALAAVVSASRYAVGARGLVWSGAQVKPAEHILEARVFAQDLQFRWRGVTAGCCTKK